MRRLTKPGLMFSCLALLLLSAPVRADDVAFEVDGHVMFTGSMPIEGGLHVTNTIASPEGGQTDPIGPYTGDGSFDVNLDTGVISNGTQTMNVTDSEGDSVTLTYSGGVNPITGTIMGMYTVAGGTGIYDGASGSGTFAGMTDGATFADVHFSGVLSTP